MSGTFSKYKKQRIYAGFQTFLYFKTISKNITLNIEAIFFGISNKFLDTIKKSIFENSVGMYAILHTLCRTYVLFIVAKNGK